mmetsp:Transcript_13364/g.22731  ORF Transcript_13364/g.22731 Transcript_13364/m.22731 type:complete len:238 (-) Transcript_13364:2234-2947(-)
MVCVKMTLRAGMLRPMAKVEVAKTTLRSPSVKRISTTSLSRGIMPAWWKPMPFSSSFSSFLTWGSSRSVPSRRPSAFFLNCLISLRSRSPMKSISTSASKASSSTAARLKKKTMQGRRFMALTFFMFLKKCSYLEAPFLWLLGPWPPSLPIPLAICLSIPAFFASSCLALMSMFLPGLPPLLFFCCISARRCCWYLARAVETACWLSGASPSLTRERFCWWMKWCSRGTGRLSVCWT